MDSITAHRAGAAFASLLLQDILQPLVGSASVLGPYGIGVLAGSIAQEDCTFTSAIAAVLEQRDD